MQNLKQLFTRNMVASRITGFNPMQRMVFSSVQKAQHTVKHKDWLMDNRHYENDFEPTSIDELEYVRSPFYDLATMTHTTDGEELDKLYENIKMKYDILNPLKEVIGSGRPTKRNVAYKRYGDDQCADPKWNAVFNHPKGTAYKRTHGSELFTV
jgi:hypothetical protein